MSTFYGLQSTIYITFDNNHLPNTIVSNSTTVATYAFNGVNAPITKTLGNTVSLNIEYNNRYQNEAKDGGSLAGLPSPKGCEHDASNNISKHDWKLNGNTIAGYNYGHDSVGNRIWSENLVTANKSEFFTFDNASRLNNFKTGTLNGSKTDIVAPTFFQTFVLDTIGNWLQFNDNGTNSINSFTDTHEMTQFKGTTQTFDSNGNQTSDGIRTFIFDAFNRLVQVKVGTVILAKYQYDAFNRRIMKSIDSNLDGLTDYSIKYVYNGQQCIEELNGSDALIKDFVFGAKYIDEVILQRTGSTDYYFTHDYRFSATSLTNTAGNIVETYDYEVYGERTASGSSLTEIGYTGQRHDTEATGLMYFRNRYYSPATGNFITCDPLGYVDGSSLYLGYFGAQGVDSLGLYQEDGHFYTTYLIAVAAGISQNDAWEMAYYSQLPDERMSFDAIGTIIRQAQFLGMNSARNQWRKDIQNYLHSLHGGDIEARRACLKKLIKRNDLGNDIKGLLIHAFADSFSHTFKDKDGKLQAYHTGKGHAEDGTLPDVIPKNKDQWKEYANELYDALGGNQNGVNGLKEDVFKMVDGLPTSNIKDKVKNFPNNLSSESKDSFFGLMVTEKFSGNLTVDGFLNRNRQSNTNSATFDKNFSYKNQIKENFKFDKKNYRRDKKTVADVLKLIKEECACIK